MSYPLQRHNLCLWKPARPEVRNHSVYYQRHSYSVCPSDSSSRSRELLWIELLPRDEGDDYNRGSRQTNGENKGDFDTRHVSQNDTGHLTSGECMADLRSACSDDHLRVHTWCCLRKCSNHTVYEARLSGGDGEGAADGLED
jgi:hypothetical protein